MVEMLQQLQPLLIKHVLPNGLAENSSTSIDAFIDRLPWKNIKNLQILILVPTFWYKIFKLWWYCDATKKAINNSELGMKFKIKNAC